MPSRSSAAIDAAALAEFRANILFVRWQDRQATASRISASVGWRCPSVHNILLNRERQLSRNPLSVEADGHCFAELNGRDRSSAHIAGVENRKS